MQKKKFTLKIFFPDFFPITKFSQASPNSNHFPSSPGTVIHCHGSPVVEHHLSCHNTATIKTGSHSGTAVMV